MLKLNLIAPLAGLIVLAACGGQADSHAAEMTADATADDAASWESSFDAISGAYSPDPGHRYIAFSYLHQGLSRPQLRWGEWDATLDWDAENPEASSVSVTIPVSSIDSGVEEYNGHLVGDQLFDAANHPEITFESTSINRTGANTGTMTGDLTIKGITKSVTLDVTFNKAVYDERGGVYKIGFSARGQVLRSDFGVDLYVPFVGDEVDLIIETEFLMAAE